LTVLEQEEAPFEFKVHLFPNNRNQNLNEEQPKEGFRNEAELKMMKFLSDFGAQDIKSGTIPDRNGEKTKFNFAI